MWTLFSGLPSGPIQNTPIFTMFFVLYTNFLFFSRIQFMTKPPLEKLLPDFPQIPGMSD